MGEARCGEDPVARPVTARSPRRPLYRQIIVLDMDLIVLRNLDHLADAPTPSLVYRSVKWSGVGIG